MSNLIWTRYVRSASSYGACSLFAIGAAAAASVWIPSSPSTTHDTIPLSRLAPMTPIVRLFRPNPNFQIAFNVQTRNPVYALERIVVEDEKSQSWHLVAVGSYCRQVAHDAWEKDRRQTYVVTGPLWLPRGKLIKNTKSPSESGDPTHFFKVFLTVDRPDGSAKPVARTVGCFVVANKEEAVNQRDDTEKALKDCLVRWTDLEAAAGLVFFPGLVNDATKAKTDALTMP